MRALSQHKEQHANGAIGLYSNLNGEGRVIRIEHAGKLKYILQVANCQVLITFLFGHTESGSAPCHTCS